MAAVLLTVQCIVFAIKYSALPSDKLAATNVISYFTMLEAYNFIGHLAAQT